MKLYKSLLQCATNTNSTRKKYFVGAMAGYLVGIVLTVAVMLVFDHGQPALLYLVPCCLLSVVVTALAHGEVSQVTEFEEATLYQTTTTTTTATATEVVAEPKKDN